MAEPFKNDGSMQSNLIKYVKRGMAGEYSRELSGKVFAGQCRLIEKGFRQGGPAGYGLRRMMIDENRNPVMELSQGQHKSLQTSMAKPSRQKSQLPKAAIKMSFDKQTVNLPLESIAAVKVIPNGLLKGVKFEQILASIREVGIIEPLVVYQDRKISEKYILLDGHLRWHALKALGEKTVLCLVSTDDEAFTYNKHINRLSTVQEHKMILRAIERGISEEKIAKSLNVDIANIIKKRNLLAGICKEAVELLKDKMVSANVFPVLRRMQPFRQIEAATLMNDADVHSESFAQALFAATPKDQLTEPDKPKIVKGLTDEQIARMESEMSGLQREYQVIEESYGKDIMSLTLAKGYLGALLGNVRIVRYLAQYHADILKEFQKITEMTSLKDAAA